MSNKYSLNRADFIKIAKTTLIYVIGAGLVFLAGQLQLLDFGQYQGFATVAVLAISYIGKEFLQGK